MADEKGFIYKPNINVMEEMANMISASRSYDANVQIADAAKQMLSRTLTLGQR
jgi:flagellar basal-body rod protein FlgC